MNITNRKEQLVTEYSKNEQIIKQQGRLIQQLSNRQLQIQGQLQLIKEMEREEKGVVGRGIDKVKEKFEKKV